MTGYVSPVDDLAMNDPVSDAKKKIYFKKKEAAT